MAGVKGLGNVIDTQCLVECTNTKFGCRLAFVCVDMQLMMVAFVGSRDEVLRREGGVHAASWLHPIHPTICLISSISSHFDHDTSLPQCFHPRTHKPSQHIIPSKTTPTYSSTMPPSPVDIPAFATTQLALLARELQTEILETQTLVSSHAPSALQRAGLALTNLIVSGQRTGLGGRTVLDLGVDPATDHRDGELPEHGLRTGDIVLVAEQPAGSAKKREVRELERKGSKGVVTRVARGSLGVALDEGREEVVFGGRVWALKLADEVTHKR